jgi:hypothetical protein
MYHCLNYNNNDTLFRICTRVGLRQLKVCYLYLDHLGEGHCFFLTHLNVQGFGFLLAIVCEICVCMLIVLHDVLL